MTKDEIGYEMIGVTDDTQEEVCSHDCYMI